VILLSVGLSVTVADIYPGAATSHRRMFYLVGLALFLVGIILRWYAIIVLGKFFTVDVAIAKEHRVVDSGPYRWVRHPSYTGALLAFLGIGFCLGNWLSILCLMIPIAAAFLWRIRIEERALLEALGQDYRAYMRRTKRLLPFLY
jgi:protein-S-isoprenylcysteine O-methyltransferase Ste14